VEDKRSAARACLHVQFDPETGGNGGFKGGAAVFDDRPAVEAAMRVRLCGQPD